jgi:hypothetical protein
MRLRTVVLVAVGVCALLASGVLGYLTLRPGDAEAEKRPGEATTDQVRTDRVVARGAGFALEAPTDMAVRKKHGSVRLISADRGLVVTVGVGGRGSLPAANARFLADLGRRYDHFTLIASERLRVDGRPAVSTSGRATNSAGVKIRIVVVTVRAKPANFTIVAFAARDADPAEVLPRVNAVVNGFEVLR